MRILSIRDAGTELLMTDITRKTTRWQQTA